MKIPPSTKHFNLEKNTMCITCCRGGQRACCCTRREGRRGWVRWRRQTSSRTLQEPPTTGWTCASTTEERMKLCWYFVLCLQNLWSDEDEDRYQVSQESETSNHTEKDSLHKPAESKDQLRREIHNTNFHSITFKKNRNALPSQPLLKGLRGWRVLKCEKYGHAHNVSQVSRATLINVTQ